MEQQPLRPLKSLKEYFSQLYLIFCVVSMTWILGDNNHDLIKYWYTFVIVSLLTFRAISFVRKGFECYLIEMCYIATLFSLPIILFDYDIKIIYPFIHGPLAFYTLIYGDAIVFNDLAKSTTFALHSGGGIVTRKLYWNGNPNLIVTLTDLTFDSFKLRLFDCLQLYLIWAIPYYIWLFSTNSKRMNMVRYSFGIKAEDDVLLKQKIQYCLMHFVGVTVTLSIGIISMHFKYLNYAIVACQVISGFAQGASYDFTGKRINFFKLFAKGFLYTKEKLTKKLS